MVLGQGDGLASNGPVAALKYKIKLQVLVLKFRSEVEFMIQDDLLLVLQGAACHKP